jgi:glycosyltransferase involved in cell wall biosynthesis
VRICFAAEYYPPFAPGGAEWSTKALAEALARRGHRVVVVTPNYGAAPVETVGGVAVRRVPFPVRLREGQGEARWRVHRNPLFYLYFAWHLWRIGRREQVEVLHAQGKAALVPAWLAGRRLGRPVVVTVRDLGLLCPLGMCPLFKERETYDCDLGQYRLDCIPYFLKNYHGGDGTVRRLLRRWGLSAYWADQWLRQAALRCADRVIGVSRGILDVYPGRLFARERARVVHTLPPRVAEQTASATAAARARYGIGEGALVLYAGKLSLGKGTRVFLEALDAIRAKVPGVRFALAGKGDWPVPPAPDVHRLGSIPQPDLFALYAAADVVVVPSVWPEPLSRVIFEAMALGRPVVATAVGGSPEQVEDGVTGLLVPKRDPAALAGAVSDLLLDPERKKKMGEAARRRLATVFDEERLVTALLAVYREAGAKP